MDTRAGGWWGDGRATVQAVAESEMTQHNRKGMSFSKNLFFFKNNCFTEFFFFCQASTWISHRYTYNPLPFEPPSHLPSHPTPLGWYTARLFPEPYNKFPLAIYFTYGNVSFHATLSIHLTLSSPRPMSVSLFSVSVSSITALQINSLVPFF